MSENISFSIDIQFKSKGKNYLIKIEQGKQKPQFRFKIELKLTKLKAVSSV